MSDTPNVHLPQMPQNTFQPSVPYNEAMQLLDAIVVLVIQDKDLTAPPATVLADAGKRWIVGPAATGVWAGHDNDIALCTGANLWLYITPGPQWRGWVTDEGKWYRFTGSAWVDDTAAGAIPEAPIDGTSYVRNNGAWAALAALVWGNLGGTLDDQTDLKAALDAKLGTSTRGVLAGVNEQTGTAYAPVLGDVGKAVRITNAAAITLTIPANATTVLPVGCMIPIYQGGAGAITIAGAAGVTLESPFGLATTDVGDFRVLFQRAADIWVIS